MNFLTFVFSLVLLFSFGTFVALEKQSGDRRLRDTYLGHILATRQLHSKWESKTYASFRSRAKETNKKDATASKKQAPILDVNPDYSRLNLWPLIQEGRGAHPFLYDLTLNLLNVFYGESLFSGRHQERVLFLNNFLIKAKEAIKDQHVSFEKLILDAPFQVQYYRMLKGTKKWDPEKGIGSPSFLEVVKAEETPSKLCLCHAHKGQLMALLGKDPGRVLYNEIHSEEAPPVTLELIESAFSKAYKVAPSMDLIDLFELGAHSHPDSGKATLIATDASSGVCLKKNLYKPKGSY